jgi:hypothetical protein
MPKTSSFTSPKFEPDGTLYFEKISTTKTLNPEIKEWITSDIKVEKLTVESQGFTREIASSLIITRKAYGSDMKEHTGFFQQKILIKIDLVNYGHDYDYAYLKKTSRHHITVTNFDTQFGCTQTISFNDERFVHKIGKAKRISEQQAKELLIKHEALALVDEVKSPENPAKEEFRINV